MISNPIKLFAGGGSYDDQKEFTYEGGSTFYHFCPNDNNLSPTMEHNLIFPADSEAHALDVLARMFDFVIDCETKQQAYYNSDEPVTPHKEEFSERASYKMKKFTMYKQALKEGKIKVTKAPMNQFYHVGWADNDTI